MKYAAETTGCFIITNSRVSSNTPNMKAVQQSLDAFYKSEEKNNLGNVQAEGATRGFYPMGAETGDKSIFERKESFSFGYDDIPDSFIADCKLVAKNMFPQTL
jgi:isopenicillin N synthase-like dioxygenase